MSFFGIGSYVPMTSRGLLFRAVLFQRVLVTGFVAQFLQGVLGIPCMGDDNVIKGRVFPPEAGQSDLNNHGYEGTVVDDLMTTN